MELTGWTVDRFGHLADHTVDGVGPHVTVLLGPNESGKTTTHHFLRWVLLGFPAANNAVFRRYRGDAAAIGGRLRLRHGDRELVLERSSRGGAARLLDPSGAVATGVALADLVGPTTPELYRSVFAVGLDELRDAAALDRDELREHVFAAGLVGGGRSAAAAIRDLDTARQQLLGARRGGQLRDLARELGDARAALAAARERSRGLGAARAEAERSEADAVATWAAVEEARRDAELYRGLVEVWPRWARRSAALREAADLPVLEAGPDPEGRLGELLAEVERARTAADALTGRRRRLEAELADCHPDRRQLAAAGELERARAALRGAEARLADLQGDRARWSQELAAARREAAELGAGWDADRVLSTTSSAAVLAEIETRAAARRAAEESHAAATHAAATASDAARTARRRLQEATSAASPTRDAGDAGPDQGCDPVPDPEELAALAAATEVLAARRQALDEVDAAVSDATAGPDAATPPADGAFPASVAVAVLAALASILLVVAGAPDRAAVAAASVAGAAAAVAVLARRRARRVLPTPRPHPLVEVARRRRAEVEALEDDVAARCARLGVEPGLTPTELRRRATATDTARRARRRLEQFAEELRGRDADAAAAARHVADTERALAAATSAWAELVRPLGLPAGAGPAAASSLVRDVEALRSRLLRLREEGTRLDRAAATAAQALDTVRCALAGIGTTPPPDADLAALERLLTTAEERCAAAAESDRRHRELLGRLGDLQDDVAAAGQETARREAAVAELLERAGVADADAFRSLVAADRRRRALHAESAAAELAVTERFGTGESAERARKELELGRVEDWSHLATAAIERAERLAEEHTGLHRRAADARRRVDDVERSDAVCSAEMDVDRLTHELADAAADWVRLTLARDALARTLEHFERDRQPEVVARAAASLSRVTGGRWDGVVSAERGFEVLAPGGARLGDSALSRGTAEQLYLCMRLSLARTHAERTARLPVLLDDVLVNADDDRNAALAREVAEAAEDLQVIVFTARRSTADALVAARDDTRVIELAPPGARQED